MQTLMQIQREERLKIAEELIGAGVTYRFGNEITGFGLGTFTNYVGKNPRLRKVVQKRNPHRVINESEKKEIVFKILTKLEKYFKKGIRTSADAWKIHLIYLLHQWVQMKTRSAA